MKRPKKKPKIKTIVPLSKEQYAQMYNQAHSDSKMKSQTLSLSEIDALFTELYMNMPTPEIGYVGDGWYKIGNGCYTGKAGWEKFIQNIKDMTNE